MARAQLTGLAPSLPAIIAIIIVLSSLFPAPSRAQLADPRPLSPEESLASEVSLAVDALDNAFVALVVEGNLWVRILGSGLTSEFLLSDIKIPQEAPSIEVNTQELAFVAFAREDNELGARGREIFLASNPGGTFRAALNISRNRIDDHSPRLCLDPLGSPRLVWVQEAGDEKYLVYYEHSRELARILVQGERPSITTDLQGQAHLAFCRGGSILVLDEGPEGFGEPIELDRIPAGEETSPLVGMDGGGRLVVVYTAAGELRMALRSEKDFQPPGTLDRGLDVGAALDFHLKDDGRFQVAYLKNGDVHVIQGADPEDPLLPEQVTYTEEAETGPRIRQDASGNLHLSFIREGRVYYTNSAPPPEAEFRAEPSAGELPLRVEFRDLSTGVVQTWSWSFGDGGNSTKRNPVHTYLESGRYTVQLEVFGPGGESRIEKAGLISVEEPSNTMEVVDVSVLPAQTDVWIPVLGYHSEPIQGFQIAGRFDPEVVALRELRLEATLTAQYRPEFFAPSISNEEGFFTCGLALDYDSPFDGRMMPPGRDQRLLYLVLDISSSVGEGESAIELENGVGPSGLNCMYVVEGLARQPVLTGGKVRVLSGDGPRPRIFIRGDIDLDGTLSLSDIILLLGFMFLGEEVSACADSLDTNDSGVIDLSDAVRSLNYLFLRGESLALPFPGRGLDPTEDGLPECMEE